LTKRITEVGDLKMKKNNGGPPLAGTVLHVTWNLNEVFKGDELRIHANGHEALLGRIGSR
jgi:hypothetical protein